MEDNFVLQSGLLVTIINVVLVMLGLLYIFSAVIVSRNLFLVNKAVETELHSFLRTITFVNIGLGVIFVLFVIIF